MRLFENEKNDSFLEKEIDFSVKNGMKINSSPPINVYFKPENSETYLLSTTNYLPPIDAKIISFIAEPYEDDVKYVDILEYPECTIKWSQNHVLNISNRNQQHLSASIALPKVARGIPYEVEVLQQDGMRMVIHKTSERYRLNDKMFDCYSLNSLINYWVRLRIKLDGKVSEWSNRIKFKPEKKRTLGRTF